MKHNELVRNTARTPKPASCLAWSFISKIKGDTTAVSPSNFMDVGLKNILYCLASVFIRVFF